MTVEVLKNSNLLQHMCQYQDGLPVELLEITQLAQSIVISPCITQTSVCPSAYLSNIPPRFIDTSYRQLFKHFNDLPNYILFLNGAFTEPTLPVHLSIVENNIKHVKMWIKHKSEWLTPAPFKLAAICGHLKIVKLLMNASKNVWCPEAMDLAAMDLAAMDGHLDVVKFMHDIENGPGCTTEAMDGAATYGHLEVVQFLNENRTEGCTTKALKGAVNNGYVKVVKYLLEHRREQYTPSDFFYPEYYRIQCHRASEEKDYIELVLTAIEANPLATIKFLRQENIFGITKNVFDKVIVSGDKATIRYAVEVLMTDHNKAISLLDNADETIDAWVPLDNEELLPNSTSNDKEWYTSKAMDLAAGLGDFETIKLLHQTGIKCCTVDAINRAAAVGRLDIVEWLHTHRTEGCTENAMTYAAAGEHFEVVKWLHEVKGLNCTNNALGSAAYNGDIEIVKYLVSIPMTQQIYYPDDFLGGGGNQTTLMLGDIPCVDTSCGHAVDRAASNGYINIVEILHDFPATTEAMDMAAGNGHLDMIKYLHTHRHERCTAQAYNYAITTNRLDILIYLMTNNCCNGDINFEQLCIGAAGGNDREILAFCMNLLQTELTHLSKQLIMYNAVTSGRLEIVKWLYEVKRFGWTSIILEEAERRGHKNIVQYLNLVGHFEDNVLDVWDIAFNIF
ncbi:hypothetical protein THRCLA_04434 [Thraustotheca clavata]|uniref:Uncharacterized protein n=1 Tax=Thraustotheca clavata TaxID=74557 RepID=A0A1V9ZZ15_9STRA|nr:hypothetical protein THRCLA_04434 [Thraustotheca clavata]